MMPITNNSNNNFHCRRQNNSSRARNFISSLPYLAVFGYLTQILTGVVGANFQGTAKPLFATHTANMWSFLLATAGFCIGHAADIMMKSSSHDDQANSSEFWVFIAVIFGSLSSVSLLSTFVSGSAGNIILCIAWICAAITFFVYQFGKLFLDACHWLYHENLTPFFFNLSNWFQGNNMLTQQQRLPV